MHTIRLRGPWQFTPLATTYWSDSAESQETGIEVPPPGTMKIPNDWSDTLGDSFHGKVLFQRYFHKPTGLEQGDLVQITLTEVNALATVFLNHEAIGTGDVSQGKSTFEVTDKLELRNLLEVIIDFPALDAKSAPLNTIEGRTGGITGEVQIEILPSSV